MDFIPFLIKDPFAAQEDDLLIIVKRALFAWLIADGDMHLKNMALLKIAEPGEKQFRSVRMNNAPNVVPIADMTTDIGVAVSFLVLAYDVDGYITSYKWDFSDGGTATARAATHTWTRDGPQRVSCNVTDDDGAWVRRTFWVNVTNMPPRASFTAPASANEGANVRVDASGSIEPGNDIVSYEWDWNGDGTWDNSSATPVFNYIYYRPGGYNLTLRVTDGEGTTNTTMRRVTINNVAPTATLTFTPASPQMEGVEFTFNASGSREPGMNITQSCRVETPRPLPDAGC